MTDNNPDDYPLMVFACFSCPIRYAIGSIFPESEVNLRPPVNLSRMYYTWIHFLLDNGKFKNKSDVPVFRQNCSNPKN
jgi:hypothetical protein